MERPRPRQNKLSWCLFDGATLNLQRSGCTVSPKWIKSHQEEQGSFHEGVTTAMVYANSAADALAKFFAARHQQPLHVVAMLESMDVMQQRWLARLSYIELDFWAALAEQRKQKAGEETMTPIRFFIVRTTATAKALSTTSSPATSPNSLC